MKPLAICLFVVGYPVAIAVIARFVPVVREQRHRWFAAHQAAVAAIIAGWLLWERVPSALFNGAWFVIAGVWYAVGARRRA